ncbi:MAG TPA: hypothetical protein PKV62_04760, partial [Oscillospiraceae bacterium]|nr:hypothetical protein [Oscillospiraceae bacterium]
TSVTDYGDYDEVINLTDDRVGVSGDGKVTFDLSGDTPDRFYFEGKTAEPYENLPWTIGLSYKMNGLQKDAEDLAGQCGVAEITLDLVPNKSTSAYEQNNFVLEAVAVFNDDEILSLEAPGAQVQAVGNFRVVLYMALPGEEEHFTLRVGSEDFSFGGFTFLIEPATLEQLDQIADLRDEKEKVEDSYDAMSSGLDAILNALDGLDGSLSGAADGLDELNSARASVEENSDSIYSGLDSADDSLEDLSDSLDPLYDNVKTFRKFVKEAKKITENLADQASGIGSAVESLYTDLRVLESKEAEDLDSLSEEDVGLDSLKGDLGALQNAAEMLQEILDSANDLKIDGDTVYGEIDGENVADLLAERTALDNAYKASGYETFGEFAQAYVYSQIRQTVYDQLYQGALAQGYSEEQAAAYAAANADQQTAQYIADNSDSVAASIEQVETLYASGDSLEQMESLIDALNADSSGKYATVAILQLLADPASDLLDSISEVIGDGNSLIDNYYQDRTEIWNQADNMMTALGETAASLDDLNEVIEDYDDELDDALEDAAEQAEALTDVVDSLSEVVGSVNEAAQDSRESLSEGTADSLANLADTLRRIGSGLTGTEDIRDAKDSISGIIEDEWDDHTGEDDNLLNADAEAAKVSLTSEKNEEPATIQVLLRSEEIKAREEEETEESGAAETSVGFWGRVANLFVKIWGGITGLFGK